MITPLEKIKKVENLFDSFGSNQAGVTDVRDALIFSYIDYSASCFWKIAEDDKMKYVFLAIEKKV